MIWLKVWHKLVVNEGTKDIGAGTRIDGHDAAETIESNRTDHRDRLPLALHGFARRLVSLSRPTVAWWRAKSEPGFIKKNESLSVQVRLAFNKVLSLGLNVWPVAFPSYWRFFLCVQPMVRMALDIVDDPTRLPVSACNASIRSIKRASGKSRA